MASRSSRHAPRWTLRASGVEPKEGDAFTYSAYFDSLLNLEDAVVERITAFAEEQQAHAILVHSGSPFTDVVCHVRLQPLTTVAVSRFRAEFSPTRDSAIPSL